MRKRSGRKEESRADGADGVRKRRARKRKELGRRGAVDFAGPI